MIQYIHKRKGAILMKITDSVNIVRKNSGTYAFFKDNAISTAEGIGLTSDVIEDFYNTALKMSYADREEYFAKVVEECHSRFEASPAPTATAKDDTIFSDFLNFFNDFNFTPSFRFLNTLINLKNETYIGNYFALMNSPYVEEVRAKVTSVEFQEIEKKLFDMVPTKKINNRFSIYFGTQGTGKTTRALKETNSCCVICNSSMSPAEIMEDFVFDEGKPTFQWSEFARAMMEGRPITLDEINLLPFETLRFLQGLLDNKPSFMYKGREVRIKDGFRIIGTMNLVVNGCTFGLPEPLVDRCSEIREFKMMPNFLAGAI